MTEAFEKDIQAMYAMADEGIALNELIEAVLAVLSRHEDELRGITHRYRLSAADTGYQKAFALTDGRVSLLQEGDSTDVTITGPEKNLLLVFQRKLAPLKALVLGKIKVKGDKGALVELAKFL